MSGAIDLGLLGPTTLVLSGRTLHVPAGRQEVALAVLALDAGRTVSGTALVDHLWGEDPPAQVRQALHTTIARVRKLVGPDRVVARGGGYALEVPPEAVDVHRFRALAAAARTADPDTERDLLAGALGLWRGEPLEGVDSDSLRAEHVYPLTEEWFAASERLIGLRLTAGEAGDVVGELRGLIARHPLRESLWCLLMSALAATGRQADALAAYQEIRGQLRDQLGVDPGSDLVATHEAVLQGSTPVPGATVEPPEVPPAPVPRQVPASPPRFTGRVEHLQALDAMADTWRDDVAAATTVVVVDGAGGMGKTALALHWAHQAAERFPDGQLHLNLRGYGPGEPVDPSWAAGTMLSSVGMADEQIPAGVEARSALLRSALAGRRVLVVLDNARDADQVRPLLPGSDAFVVVTSRNQLRGLVSRDGARRLTLGPLSEAESRALLESVAAAAAAGAAKELADLCGHVPLALSVAAERVARTADSGPAELLTELRDEQGRLEALSGGDDLSTDVRAVLSWSYRTVDDDDATLFRLLGSAPGPDISVPAATALADLREGQVRRQLDRLSVAHLVEEKPGPRFEQHDLIRAYAAELATSEDGAEERAAAQRRLLTWYQGSAVAARATLRSNQPIVFDGTDLVEPLEFSDRATAVAWFDDEHANLAEAVFAAATMGMDRCAWQLAATLTAYFLAKRPWAHPDSVLECGLDCARRAGDRYGEALLLACLGDSHHFRQRYAESVACSRHALELYQQVGDDWGQVGMLTNIGTTLIEDGQIEAALEHHRRAADASAALNAPAVDALVLGNLAAGLVAAGQYADAVDVAERALVAARTAGEGLSEADILDELGNALVGLGSYSAAIGHFHTALAFYRASGHPFEIATLHHLAGAHLAAGQPGSARETWRRALAKATQLGDPRAAQLRAKLASLT